jgi:signal transduction histidine kinase
VTVADQERRRLERDLHDGAQQRLVALALTLSRAAERVDERPGETRELLADGERQLRKALEELRRLAAGIRPAILSDAGLGAALESLAENAPVPVTLRQAVDRRLPDQVEAAAYFAVCEAAHQRGQARPRHPGHHHRPPQGRADSWSRSATTVSAVRNSAGEAA